MRNRKSVGSRNKQSSAPRRVRFVVYSVGGLLLLVTTVGLLKLNELRPANHFAKVPIVAAPIPIHEDSSGRQSMKTVPQSQVTSNLQSTAPPSRKASTVNVLLLGSDVRPGHTAGHSDSILLIHANLLTHEYYCLSIPRDTRVYMPAYGFTKLTSVMYLSQAMKGIKAGTLSAVQEISSLTGVTVNYYAVTNYWGLEDIVNSIGGIRMYVPYNMTLGNAWYRSDNGKFISKGYHFFRGRMVAEVVHDRYSLSNSDYGRQRLQEDALVGIEKKLFSPSHISELPRVMKTMSKYLVDTNMSISDMLSLAWAVKGSKPDVHYYQINGSEKMMYNDALKAYDDEIILNKKQLHNIVIKHFT